MVTIAWSGGGRKLIARSAAALTIGVALSIAAAFLPTAPEANDLPIIGVVVEQAVEVLGVGEADADTVRYCGIATCTDYVSKSQVRTAASRIRSYESRAGDVIDMSCSALRAMAAVIFRGLSLILDPIANLICGAIRGKFDSITNTIKDAAHRNQCFAIAFPRFGPNNPAFATGWYRYSCNWT